MGINPYKADAGSELDGLLANAYWQEAERPEPFSSEDAAANKLRSRIESLYRRKIVTGLTKTTPALHFARLETDPSTSTEAMGESSALAIARLGLVLAMRRSA